MEDPSLSDGAIIADVLAGRTERFAEIVRRYQGALRRAASSRLGSEHEADDAVQETLMCAFRSLASYDSRWSFRTWLWTILLNQCRRRRQRAGRWPQVRPWADHPQDESTSLAGDGPPAESEGPAAALLSKERSQLLEALLQRLPEPQADALRLRFYGDLKFHEIADAMGCSLSSAKNRVRWGLTRMAELMRQGALR
jgi:RNA polymerase sigma-70 factor (ECF subfamily)